MYNPTSIYKVLTLFVLIFLQISCANKKHNDTINSCKAENANNDIEQKQQIVLGVSVHNNKLPTITYIVKNEDDNHLEIEPNGDYYNMYVSNDRVVAEQHICVPSPVYYEYPTIDVYLVNNYDYLLNISELSINVEESRIDNMPYIYLCTTREHVNTLTLCNYSCYNWGNLSLEYKILRKGEVFDGKYSHKKTIPFFYGEDIIDFTEDLESLGYDYSRVCQLSETNEDFMWNCFYNGISKENLSSYKDYFYPFEISKESFDNIEHTYIPYARIYGKISFSNSLKVIPFKANICLTSVDGLGAITCTDDKFDVKFKTNDSHYTLKYPYKTQIRPGGSERIRLTLSCDKSTIHSFNIQAKNEEGVDIHSKKIQIHMLNHYDVKISTDIALKELYNK